MINCLIVTDKKWNRNLANDLNKELVNYAVDFFEIGDIDFTNYPDIWCSKYEKIFFVHYN